MPPRKKTKTLQEITMATVASMTNQLCLDIESEFGGWKSPDSQNKLMSVKMYLSTIEPLFNDLFKAVDNLYFLRRKPGEKIFYKLPFVHPPNIVKDKYLLLDLFMCNRLTSLNFSKLDLFNDCFTDAVFWTNHLSKLNNIVELDIMRVRITDASFQAIGDVCTNLRRISIISDLQYASMESLSHILKCKELQDISIGFCNWDEENEFQFTTMLLTGLPNLEHFENFENWLLLNIENNTSLETPLKSMRKVYSRWLNSVEVGIAIKVCPNLKDITLVADYQDANGRPDFVEGTRVLKTLAESSLQLHSLYLSSFTFCPEMICLITSNCTHLTRLKLRDCEGRRISVNDIYTIGVSCPKIEDFFISESYCDVDAKRLYIKLHSPNIVMEEPTFVTTPHMFVHLKTLFLHSNVDWDQRILPLILRYAANLTVISLRDIFKPTSTSQDTVSEVLNFRPLPELETLCLEFERYGADPYTIPLRVDSVKRLLNCCPNLSYLSLTCPMKLETVRYLSEVQADMADHNFDFSLEFECVTVTSHVDHDSSSSS